MVDNKEWHRIGDRLTARLQICQCQRKLKSIVETLLSIKNILDHERPLAPEQWAVIAWLDTIGLLSHGSNVEYPWLEDQEFWEWLVSIKDSPNLEDN